METAGVTTELVTPRAVPDLQAKHGPCSPLCWWGLGPPSPAGGGLGEQHWDGTISGLAGGLKRGQGLTLYVPHVSKKGEGGRKGHISEGWGWESCPNGPTNPGISSLL